jgi:hypothetical protein
VKLLIRTSFTALLTLLVSVGMASGQTKTNELSESRSELIEATQEYKANTQQLGQLQEEELTNAKARTGELRQLVAEGIVARAELEQAEQSLSALEAKLAASQQQIEAADQMIAEIQAADELAKTQLRAALANPQPKRRFLLTPTILRYGGTANWSLSHLTNIQVFFNSRFGRSLPISTIGQSATHNQLRYDHRNAVDVALHPDTVEGQTLINYLRSQGIPFLAFRGAIPGVATGAHVHIGHPSHRL